MVHHLPRHIINSKAAPFAGRCSNIISTGSKAAQTVWCRRLCSKIPMDIQSVWYRAGRALNKHSSSLSKAPPMLMGARLQLRSALKLKVTRRRQGIIEKARSSVHKCSRERKCSHKAKCLRSKCLRSKSLTPKYSRVRCPCRQMRICQMRRCLTVRWRLRSRWLMADRNLRRCDEVSMDR